METIGGPYVAAALICTGIEPAQTGGAQDWLGVANEFLFDAPPPDGPPISFAAMGVFAFHAGSYLGNPLLTVTCAEPSGTSHVMHQAPLLFGPFSVMQARPVALVFNIAEPGFYWLTVRLDEQVMTRLPVRFLFR